MNTGLEAHKVLAQLSSHDVVGCPFNGRWDTCSRDRLPDISQELAKLEFPGVSCSVVATVTLADAVQSAH